MDHKELERWHRLRNIKKASQFLVVLGVVLLVGGYTVSRLIDRSPARPDSEGEAPAGIRISNFTYSATGADPWELMAGRAEVSSSLDKVTLQNLKVVYGSGKGDDIVVSAEKGALDRKTQNISASGEVTVKYKDFLFKTNDLKYTRKTGVAETDSPVSLEGASLKLKGEGMKVEVKKREITVEHNVEAVLFNVKWVAPGQKLPM
jgi:LPS export ABC transporter protein LptC